MPVSKRTRYEVLKRDNHTCRYCGASAPDVKLTVDHVTPVALGGSDKPENLVTACQDCNAGKASTSPDATVVEDVKQADLRWSAAIKRAVELRAIERGSVDRYVGEFEAIWSPRWAPDDAYSTIEAFYKSGLPVDELKDAAWVALRARHADDRFRYFCGVAWRRVGEIQEAAKALIEADDVDGGGI